MRPVLSLVILALALVPVVHAGDAPPATTTPPAADAGPQRDRGGDANDRMKRMIEQNPELQGVDPNTPQGQDKIREVMQKRMEANAPRMRERMTENQTAAHAEIKTATGLSDEEFAAIEPLLKRVEDLRQHRMLVDRSASGISAMMGGRRGGMGGFSMDPKIILGDTPLDPTAAEIQEAVKALKALVGDPQANATETELALARLRKARETWQTAMTKAQEELRSVLNRRQEAILVDRGILE